MTFSPSDLAHRANTRDEIDDDAVTATITEALAPLHDLADLPTGGHVEVFESIQQALSDALSTVDDA